MATAPTKLSPFGHLPSMPQDESLVVVRLAAAPAISCSEMTVAVPE